MAALTISLLKSEIRQAGEAVSLYLENDENNALRFSHDFAVDFETLSSYSEGTNQTSQVTKLSSNIFNWINQYFSSIKRFKTAEDEEYLAFKAYLGPVGFKSKSIVNLC